MPSDGVKMNGVVHKFIFYCFIFSFLMLNSLLFNKLLINKDSNLSTPGPERPSFPSTFNPLPISLFSTLYVQDRTTYK